MGNPSSSDPSHSSPIPKPSTRHRHSLSISSLPLEKLGKINCESTNLKRTSVSALSSPAKAALTEKPEKLSTASFLGHGGHQEPTATIARRFRPASRNGHRRVGSGSNIVTLATSPSSKTTTAWDNFNYSPRAKSAAGNNATTSIASAPSSWKKLDKHTAAKFAASPFHSPANKLERSVSLSRVAHQRGPSTEWKTATSVERNHATEVSEPVKDEEEATQQGIPIEDPGTRASISDQEPSKNAAEMMPREENTHPAQNVASTAGDESANRLCEISETNNMEIAPDSPVSIATLFDEGHEETNPGTEGETNPSTEGETNAPRVDEILHVLSATETLDPEKGSEASERDIISRIGSVSVDDDDDDDEEEEAQSSPVNNSTFSRRLDECGNSSKRISVMKSTLRKRRRSQSASGIAAVLLRSVVSVPDSAAGALAVTSKRVWGPPEMISRVKSAIEIAAAQIETASRPIHAARVVCQTESEDAVKATYSKFVDIEIGLGHGCVELVQHSEAVVDRHVVVDDTGWKRKQHGQAASASRERLTVGKSPRHHPHVKVNTCTIHEGKVRPRKIKTIRRGRINSYDLDSLTEFLKTTNSFSGDSSTEILKPTKSFTPPQDDKTATKPRPPSPPPSPSPSPSPPPPPQQQQQQQSTTAPHQPPKQFPTVFISRLQAPKPTSFSSYIDSSYRPGGCTSSSNSTISSMSILAPSQPSFSFSSSSHQDKLWEEQADIYSSGGRGTPERRESDVDGRIPDLHPGLHLEFNLLHHHQGQAASPGSYGTAHSQQPHRHQQQQYQQHHGAAMRRRSGLSGGGGGGGVSESGANGHFMQQIMSRIRGSGLSPGKRAGGGYPGPSSNHYKARELDLQAKRRNSSAWSSCICFSVKSS